jgi:DNA-directed RNA polymerase specialized sigma24 family protein
LRAVRRPALRKDCFLVSRHRIATTRFKEEELEALVARCRAGDEEAWAHLWLALAPLVENVARRFRVTGRLSRCPDQLRDMVTRVMGELREDGFRLLAALGERLSCRDGSFQRWLWTVARNSAISHVREHPEYLGRREAGARRWANHVPLTEALEDVREDASPPLSRRIEVHRILTRARDLLEPAQLEALYGWLQGEAATPLVRSAVERLRYQFAAKNRPARLTDRPKKASTERQDRTTRRPDAGGGERT